MMESFGFVILPKSFYRNMDDRCRAREGEPVNWPIFVFELQNYVSYLRASIDICCDTTSFFGDVSFKLMANHRDGWLRLSYMSHFFLRNNLIQKRFIFVTLQERKARFKSCLFLHIG